VTRREELEANVVEQWDDADAWLVLADHLLDQGDRQGELVRAQLAAETELPKHRRHKIAVTRLLRELVVPHLPAQAAERVRELGWRRGYLAEVTVASMLDVDILETLPMAFGRLLRRIVFGAGVDDWYRALGTLQRFPYLEAVECSHTNVDTIVPLAEVPSLRRLGLTVTKATSLLPALVALRHLEELDVQCSGLGELPPIAEPLRRLNVSHNQIDDVAALASCPTLRAVNLAYNRLPHFRALAGLPVEDLDLQYAQVADLTPLATCSRLRRLSLSYNKAVRDLTPLAGLPLDWLRLDTTELTDLTALAGCHRLRALNLESSGSITRIEPLAGLRLEQLDLCRTSVTDIAPLAECHELRTLNLATLEVDLSPLQACSKLEHLVIKWRASVDISALRDAPSLTEIDLWMVDDLRDIEVLLTMPKLQRVRTYNKTYVAWLREHLPHVAT
jgi:uncharacterized protein (TIGR02996 family)